MIRLIQVLPVGASAIWLKAFSISTIIESAAYSSMMRLTRPMAPKLMPSMRESSTVIHSSRRALWAAWVWAAAWAACTAPAGLGMPKPKMLRPGTVAAISSGGGSLTTILVRPVYSRKLVTTLLTFSAGTKRCSTTRLTAITGTRPKIVRKESAAAIAVIWLRL